MNTSTLLSYAISTSIFLVFVAALSAAGMYRLPRTSLLAAAFLAATVGFVAGLPFEDGGLQLLVRIAVTIGLLTAIDALSPSPDKS